MEIQYKHKKIWYKGADLEDEIMVIKDGRLVNVSEIKINTTYLLDDWGYGNAPASWRLVQGKKYLKLGVDTGWGGCEEKNIQMKFESGKLRLALGSSGWKNIQNKPTFWSRIKLCLGAK